MVETKMDSLLKQLEAVEGIAGVSGREKKISSYLKEQYEPYCDEIIYDNLGSIYGAVKSDAADAMNVMVSAHMDELGFLVQKIEKNGLIRGLALGKVEKNALLGQQVLVTMQDGQQLTGVILGQDKENLALNKNGEVLCDFGFSDKEEAEEAGLQLGDMITFAPKFSMTGNQKEWLGTNWNGRINVSQTIDLLKGVHEADLMLPFNLYVGCTVQEQVGLRGAQTAANLVKPDFSIVLDTCRAWDYQDGAQDLQGELGKGVLLTYYDISVLPHRLPLSDLKALCEREGIPCQFYYSLEDSDGGWFGKLRTGSPVLFFNLPVRNMNTPSQAVSASDYHSAGTALLQFVKELKTERIVAYLEENR